MTPGLAVLAAVLLTPAAPQSHAASQPATTPVFGVAVERIRVEVLVTRGGRPVRGLQATDFDVRDSGVRKELEPVLEEGAAVDTLLLLDGSESVSGPKLTALREAARAFLDELRPGERAALLTFSSRTALLQPLTEQTALVRGALARAPSALSTSLCDAVYATLRTVVPGPRRSAVVVFSDGLDNTSWLQPDQVVEAARRSDAVVYAVLAGLPAERDQSILREVASATGGGVFEVRQPADLRARFLDVLEQIRNRYVLSFAPEAADTPGWHPLSVKLKRGSASVVARPGYWRPAAPK